MVCGVTTCDWQWFAASSDLDLRLTWILIGENQWEEHRDKYINESPVYKPTIVIVVVFPTCKAVENTILLISNNRYMVRKRYLEIINSLY